MKMKELIKELRNMSIGEKIIVGCNIITLTCLAASLVLVVLTAYNLLFRG